MAQPRSFGRARPITGKAGTFDSTLVPMDFLNFLVSRPIPITVSGSSNVTFNIAASTTNPVSIWNGRDFIHLKETLSHTMANVATNAVIATTGAYSEASTPGAVGVKYYYVGLDTDGAVAMAPSDAPPSFVEAPFNVGILGHPGPSRDRHWNYVGFSIMSTTAPAFLEFSKINYTYHLPTDAAAVAPSVTTYAEADFSALLPQHGVQAGGYVSSAATSAIIYLGAATDPVNASVGVGVIRLDCSGTSTHPAVIPFSGLPVTSNGKIFAQTTGSATTITVTQVTDVV